MELKLTNMISILINADGTIGAISVNSAEYPHVCPQFINFENFQKKMCINIVDYLFENSWVDLELD